MSENLIEVKNLKKYFTKESGIIKKNTQYIKAVDNVSFTIRKGETLGLGGESGCGKSKTGRTLIKIYNPTGGQIFLDGNDIYNIKEKEMKTYRKRKQMIF